MPNEEPKPLETPDGKDPKKESDRSDATTIMIGLSIDPKAEEVIMSFAGRSYGMTIDATRILALNLRRAANELEKMIKSNHH